MTYCACCVENFKHTLLAIYLHLLQERKKRTKQNKGSLTQMVRGFIFRSASTSVEKTRGYVSMANRGREKDRQTDQRGERKTKPSKGADTQHGCEEGEPAGQRLTSSSSHSAGSLTFLYESSIVGSYFSTKIP